MSHKHSLYDTDPHYVIDPITKAITTESPKVKLMQYDHNSERFTFEIPRYVDGHDMTLCNKVKIHFNNAAADKTGVNKDAHPVDDMQLAPDDENIVIFSWLVSQNATQLAGMLSFSVCFSCVADDGTLDYAWHTDIYSGITISDGIHNDEAIVNQYSDVLEQWKRELFGAGDSVMADIENKADEQIASIADARSAAVSAVEAKGAETLETIPDDYTELYGMAYDAVRTRANAIVENVEGDVIAANDCSSDYLRGLRVFGKSEQFKTTGKNLLCVPNTIATTKGVAFTVDSDGIVSATGTPTEVFAVSLYGTYGEPISFPAGTYIISGGADENHYLRVRIHNSDGTLKTQKYDFGSGKEFTVEDGELISISIYFAALDAVSGMKFKPMVRHATVTDDTYEPYTGGVASPSPEYPQKINSVENPQLGVYGKNLITSFVDSTKTLNGVTFTVNGDGSITIDGTATEAALFNMVTLYETTPVIRPGAEYIISGATSVAAIQVWEWQGKWVQRASTSGEKTFTLSADAKGVLIRYVVNPGLTADNLTVYPMLRLATDLDSTYEQAKTVQTVTISHTLHGIPVSSGGNYTDANGQQWICDEVDLARGVYVQRVHSLTLTGEESLERDDDSTWFDGCYTVYTANSNPAHKHGELVCSFLPNVNNGVLADGGAPFGVGTHGAYMLLVRFGAEINTTELAQAKWREAVAAGGVINVILADPIVTALTDEEIFNFSQLHSNYPNTTVLNDAGAWMEVAYNADTQLYFDNSRGASDEQVQKSVNAWLTAHFTNAEEVAF